MKNDHTPIIHFCNTRFGYDLIKSKENWFRYDLVWNKMRGVSFLLANKMPMKSHENIYIFAKKGATYYRKDIEGDFEKWSVKENRTTSATSTQYGATRTDAEGGEGKRCALSVLDVRGGNSKHKQHPTQKPNDLYAFLIERYSKEGDTILDPTAGSFASCFTAKALGRNAIGMEMDKTFYEKATKHLLDDTQ